MSKKLSPAQHAANKGVATAVIAVTPTEAEVKVKKPKKVRVDFPGLDPANKLIGMPEGYSFKEHKGLKRKQFATDAAHLRYKAAQYTFRADRMLGVAGKLTAKADRFEKFGDDATRKKADKAAQLKEQLAKLREELGEDVFASIGA